ncbi:MAG: nucleotide exchange factor GrpE [Planctomycetota bacterium]|nr:nucleotide exchange factor GrpE [Planctomycetota bacterium]
MRKRRKQDEAPEAETPETAEDAQQPQEGGEAESPAPEPSPEERVAELEGLLARSRADYANLRRRTLADQDAAVSRAEGALLCELLTFADWLDMALITEVTSPDAITIKEGVRLTRDQLAGLLSARGVEPISTEGAFDPGTHQAVATVEDAEAEPGSIAAVVRKGWRRGEAVLRHAQVKVVAAPEPPASAEDDAAVAAEEA